MSRKTLELETHATKFVSYKTYTSEIGHIHIAFNYGTLVRLALLSLMLLEKVILGAVFTSFALNFTEA